MVAVDQQVTALVLGCDVGAGDRVGAGQLRGSPVGSERDEDDGWRRSVAAFTGSPLISDRMFAATTPACRLARLAIFGSSSAVMSPTAKTRSCPRSRRYRSTRRWPVDVRTVASSSAR